MNQRTIENVASVQGIGLHSGKKVHVNFKPLTVNEGIKFCRTDLNPHKTITIDDLQLGSHKRCTTLSKDGAEVSTVEHLLSALWALSIDNILIEIDGGELPGLDGSAKDFFDCLKNAGVKDQDAPARIIKIKEPIWCESGEAFLGIFPSNSFKVAYILEAPVSSIGKQFLSLELDKVTFCREIIPARTFCLKEEALQLLKMGFGQGANTQNTLIMDKEGPLENVLRFSDEPIRHKILDLVGDLYLTGSQIEGRVVALRSGHELNRELVCKIKEQHCERRLD